MKLRLSHQGLMLVSGVLLFELVLVAIFAGWLGRADQDLESSEASVSIVGHIDKLRSIVTDMELSAPQLSGRDAFQRDVESLRYEFGALKLLLRDDPAMQAELDRLHEEMLAHVFKLEAESRNPTGIVDYADFQKFRATTLSYIDTLSARYKRATEFLPDRATIYRGLMQSGMLVAILIIAIAAVGTTLFFMQGIVNRLSVVADNSVRFGRGEELNPPLDGADEIATLDRILHETIAQRTMIDSLLRESEARTRSLIENMPVGVVTINEDGIVESTNPQIETIFGYSYAELIGDHMIALFSLPQEVDKNKFTQALADNASGKLAKFESRRKNGEVFPVEMTLNEFNSIDGKRYLAMLQDITERERAERFKQELIAMVSHDLRSPLTSVQGVITLLGRGMYGQLSDVGEQRVKAAEQSISRLLHLVDDLLDLERMEAGRLKFNQQSVPLSSMIDRSIESVYDFAQQSQLTFDAPASGLEAFVDEDRLVQVIVNLLSNAIKFSPRGASIQIVVQKADGEQVEVQVIDQGPGIPPEYLDTIFDRFHQVAGAAPQHKGTGLGLAICKAIIEGHNGTIGVSSQPGEGSRFWFKVPSRLKPNLMTITAA